MANYAQSFIVVTFFIQFCANSLDKVVIQVDI